MNTKNLNLQGTEENLNISFQFLPFKDLNYVVTGAMDQVAAVDFVQEGKNAERTARNFKTKKIIKVPHIFWVCFQLSQLNLMSRIKDISFSADVSPFGAGVNAT